MKRAVSHADRTVLLFTALQMSVSEARLQRESSEIKRGHLCPVRAEVICQQAALSVPHPPPRPATVTEFLPPCIPPHPTQRPTGVCNPFTYVTHIQK